MSIYQFKKEIWGETVEEIWSSETGELGFDLVIIGEINVVQGDMYGVVYIEAKTMVILALLVMVAGSGWNVGGVTSRDDVRH